jgi:hypothetical protein
MALAHGAWFGRSPPRAARRRRWRRRTGHSRSRSGAPRLRTARPLRCSRRSARACSCAPSSRSADRASESTECGMESMDLFVGGEQDQRPSTSTEDPVGEVEEAAQRRAGGAPCGRAEDSSQSSAITRRHATADSDCCRVGGRCGDRGGRAGQQLGDISRYAAAAAIALPRFGGRVVYVCSVVS